MGVRRERATRRAVRRREDGIGMVSREFFLREEQGGREAL
jgi:hypothetical protein